MIKLSIIVPIYNVEQYLRKCVDSLLAQNLPSSEYEIILVDDGSPDACPQICDEYARMSQELRVKSHELPCIRVIHRKNGGLSAARNSGIEVAQGEYICFVDSDDYWEENVLGGLMAQVERDNLDVLRFRYQNVRICEDGQYEVFQPYKRDQRLDNDYSGEVTDGVTFLNTRMNTQCYAVMFIVRRSLLLMSEGLANERVNVCLFTPGIYFEDTDWTPRMLCRANRVASTNTIVYNYLQRAGSITKAVNRSKQQKILDDKMRLIGEMQKQAAELQKSGRYNRWYSTMIAETVVSIIGLLSVEFYDEKEKYLQLLSNLNVYPIHSRSLKVRLINCSPRFAVQLLHLKNK